VFDGPTRCVLALLSNGVARSHSVSTLPYESNKRMSGWGLCAKSARPRQAYSYR